MRKKQRIRRRREEWQRLVKQFEGSGLSQKVFCRRHDLNETTFRLWRGRVRSPTPDPVPFVELVPAGAAAPPEAPWSIELALPGGVTLRMRG